MANDKRRRTAPRADAVQNPDTWRSGVRFGLKALNVKSVSRAKNPMEVLLVCLRHNLRQRNGDHRHRSQIDPGRSGNNRVMLGPEDSEEAAEAADAVFQKLSIKPPRKDTIVGIELVFQPPDGHDTPEFYDACIRWVRAHYEHPLSAVVHRDQKRPHMHVLVLALAGGKFAGAVLTSGPRRLQAQRTGVMTLLRKELNIRADRPRAAQRSFADIMTSKGKGAQTPQSAAKSDAALEVRGRQRYQASAAATHQSTRGGGNQQAHLMAQRTDMSPDLLAQRLLATDLLPPTSYCAACAKVRAIFSAWAAEAACLAVPVHGGARSPDAWAFTPVSGSGVVKASANDDRWAA